MYPAISIILGLLGQTVYGADLDLLTAASTNFSQNLYQQIATDKDNAVYSPFSIHACLSMCLVGARGDTATEILQTLGLSSLSDPHHTYHDLIAQMNNVTDVQLNTADGLFANPNVPIQPDFVKEVQTEYFASSFNFDMAAPEGPEKAINDYVSNNTKGMIKDIIPSGTIDDSTALILVNTIFFNGTWAKQFSEHKTVQRDFQQLGGATSQVEMMNDDRTVRIKRGVHGADVAELPFKGNQFSLYIVLPQQVDGITNLEEQLTVPGAVDEFFEGLQPRPVKLSIPKFKIESSFGLNAPLQNLGILRAFNSRFADFSGITGDQVSIYITDVLHKAMIEVKETGTVAAASTAIVFTLTAAIISYTESFVADHPFLFFLRDNTSGDILFQGKFSG